MFLVKESCYQPMWCHALVWPDLSSMGLENIPLFLYYKSFSGLKVQIKSYLSCKKVLTKWDPMTQLVSQENTFLTVLSPHRQASSHLIFPLDCINLSWIQSLPKSSGHSSQCPAKHFVHGRGSVSNCSNNESTNQLLSVFRRLQWGDLKVSLQCITSLCFFLWERQITSRDGAERRGMLNPGAKKPCTTFGQL